MKLKEAIIRARKDLGDNIITQDRFVNVLDDYGVYKEKPQLRTLVGELSDHGFLKQLYKDFEDGKNVDLIQKDIAQKVSEKLPFQLKLVRNFIKEVLSALQQNASNNIKEKQKRFQEREDRARRNRIIILCLLGLPILALIIYKFWEYILAALGVALALYISIFLWKKDIFFKTLAWIVGLALLVLAIIFIVLAIKFIIDHIWWFVGGIVLLVVLFFVFFGGD